MPLFGFRVWSISFERFVELLRTGVNPNTKYYHDNTLLHFVASRSEENQDIFKENMILAKILIRNGADINAQNERGETPLRYAVAGRRCRMAEFLLEANADVNLADSFGNKDLICAVWECRNSLQHGYDIFLDPDLYLVRLLLKFNSSPFATLIANLFPLPMAIQNGHLGIVKELLKRNAYFPFFGFDMRTLIHEALAQEKVIVDIVLEIMRYGCRFDIRNRFGNTPMLLYIPKLFHATIDKLEESKYIFKLFLFRRNTFNSDEVYFIKRLDEERNFRLPLFISYCEYEVSQMLRDFLTPRFSVYDIALCGFYGRSHSHIPLEILDTLLNKLMNFEYPVYCDLIVSGIGNPYLNYRFAELCSFVGNTSRVNLNFDVLYLLSYYLSHFDLLNMMIACQY